MFKLTTKLKQFDEIINLSKKLQLGQVLVENEKFDGRAITFDGSDKIFLGNCNYLALATDPEIIETAKEGIDRYGAFFSSSRSFAALSLIEQLESEWESIFNKPCLITPTTSLGHIANLPILVGEKDLVILDQQVHNSVFNAVMICKAKGTEVAYIHHNRLDILEAKILDNKQKYEKIWFMADGVYSMFGDTVPEVQLTSLLNKYDNFYAYVDDSHGMSWKGHQGVGSYLSQTYFHDKLFMALSTNKGTGTGGALMVYPDIAYKNLIRNCGSSIVFSGPLSPSMIMAGIKAAEIHKRADFAERQAKLDGLMTRFIDKACDLNIPLVRDDKTPVFFIGMGSEEPTIYVAKGLQKAGFFVDVAGFPSVPKNNIGIRITLTNYLNETDIDNFLNALSSLILDLEKTSTFDTKKVLVLYKNHNKTIKANQ